MKLKTGLLALLLGAITCIPVSAQLSVGGFLNFNMAGISVVPAIGSEDYSRYLGIGIGGVVHAPLSGNLELQAEPMFVQKGGKVTEGGDVAILKILYVDFPVFVKVPIPVGGTLVPYILLGANAGLRVSAKVRFPDGGTTNVRGEFNALDLGVGAGAGAEHSMGNFILFGEVKYVRGINNINAEVRFDPGESRVRNKGLQVMGGVKVPVTIN